MVIAMKNFDYAVRNSVNLLERNLEPRNLNKTLQLQLINKRADTPGVVVGPVVGAAVVVGEVAVVGAAIVVGAAVVVGATVVVVGAAVVVGAFVVVGTSNVGFDWVAVGDSVVVAEAYVQVNFLRFCCYIYAFHF